MPRRLTVVLVVAVIAAYAIGISPATAAASYHYDRGSTPAASSKDAAPAPVAELARSLDEAARDFREWSYDDRLEPARAFARWRGPGSAPQTIRLAQDIAVSPTAPRALPLNRPVGGSATQNQFVQSRIASLQEQGATAFRVNQQQVNVDGVQVGINRPDLQYTLNGQRYYEEFDTLLSTRGPAHAVRIEANDPFGIINLLTVG